MYVTTHFEKRDDFAIKVVYRLPFSNERRHKSIDVLGLIESCPNSIRQRSNGIV